MGNFIFLGKNLAFLLKNVVVFWNWVKWCLKVVNNEEVLEYCFVVYKKGLVCKRV